MLRTHANPNQVGMSSRHGLRFARSLFSDGAKLQSHKHGLARMASALIYPIELKSVAFAGSWRRVRKECVCCAFLLASP